MNKRKELAALYSANPWLQDMVSSLEAQIATLSDKYTVIHMNYDETLEENEELEDLAAIQGRALTKAHEDLASLRSSHSHLVAACKELLRQNEELQNEQEETTNLASEAEELQGEDQEDQ